MTAPTSPIDFGYTKGVSQRISLSLPAIRASRDFDFAFQEALRRRSSRHEALPELEPYDELHVSAVHGAGQMIQIMGAEMAAADHALERAREGVRELCLHRETLRLEAYKKLSRYRKWARDMIRPTGSETRSCLDGDTERDPLRLLAQIRSVAGWATDDDGPPPETVVPFEAEWPKTVRHLQELHDELDAAVVAVADAKAALSQPLEKRILAIKAFDREFQRGARFLEQAFEYLGLPTLATAVRPHLKGTGRVGRPSKRPPRDEHPDLVREVLNAGLLPKTPAAAEKSGKSETTARRRIVFHVAGFKPVSNVEKRGKVRRRPEPRNKARVARRRRYVAPWVQPAMPAPRQETRVLADRAIRPAAFRPRGRGEQSAEAANAPTWATRALEWWLQRREAY